MKHTATCVGEPASFINRISSSKAYALVSCSCQISHSQVDLTRHVPWRSGSGDCRSFSRMGPCQPALCNPSTSPSSDSTPHASPARHYRSMQGQKAERGPRGRYARLICRGCRARKIKCVLPSPVGPLDSPPAQAASCERCRNLDLECIIEHTSLGRPPAKRANRAKLASKSPQSDLSTPRSGRQDEEKASRLSDSIRQYLFSGAMDDNLMLQRSRNPTYSSADDDLLYHAMANTSTFIAGVLAKDPSFGSGIQLMSTWSTPLTEIVSHDLAITLDNL